MPRKVGTSIATIPAIPRSISTIFHASHASRGKSRPRGGPSSARQGSVHGSHGNKAFDIMPCHAMHGRWLSLTLLLPQLLAKHLPYKELL